MAPTINWKGTPEQRFWRFVYKTDSCWFWLGYLKPNGYGEFSPTAGKHIYAHRASWELHFGPIPNATDILHTCDTRQCVNPAHLFVGDPQSNARDRLSKGITTKDPFTTHCKYGHRFASETPRQKICVECRRARWKKYYYGTYKRTRPPISTAIAQPL